MRWYRIAPLALSWSAAAGAQRPHQGRQIYQRGDGCYCDFATDIAAEEGVSGSPVLSAQGDVLGILTLAGSGKFRGLSFGASFEEAAGS